MSMITDVWQQLVRRRLWPLAVLLLGALVAVPVLLSEDPAPPPAPPAALPATADKAEKVGDPVVTLADAADAPRRHVLGVRKDPFEPAPAPKAKAGEDSTGDANPTAGPAPTTGGGPSAPSGGAPAPDPTPAPSGGDAPPAKRTTYPRDSLTIRFGGDDALERMVLEPGDPLPASADGEDAAPLLVYVGLADHGRTARFLVDASVRADGDGRCDTGADNACETLHLRAGDTEFLDVVDAEGQPSEQYQLDLVTIHARKRTGRRAHVARAPGAVAAVRAGDRAPASLSSGASAGDALIGAAGVVRLLASL